MLFLDNPAMDGTAQLAPAFVGRDMRDMIWSETMFLYCLHSLRVVFRTPKGHRLVRRWWSGRLCGMWGMFRH